MREADNLADRQEIWEYELTGILRARPGLYRDRFAFKPIAFREVNVPLVNGKV